MGLRLVVPILLLVASCASGGNILFVSPFASKSHLNVFKSLAYGLAERGHKVTHIAPYPASSSAPTGYSAVVIPGAAKVMEEAGNHMWEQQGNSGGVFTLLGHVLNGSSNACRSTYSNPGVKKIMAGSEKFDLIFVSLFFSDCFLPLSNTLKAPFAYMSPAGMFPAVQVATGNRYPLSYVPFPVLPVSSRMTFLERVANVCFLQVMGLFEAFGVDPGANAVARDVFGPATPPVAEIRKNVSLVVLNAFFGMDQPLPHLPGIVEAGGMHCKSAGPLQKDLEDWVTGSKNGFIYFSLGSAVQGKLMPEKFRKMFIEAFSRLSEYRILWKWETEIMDDLPKHVKLSKWLPQQDLLGHANIKLFITHGGLLSTQEATYHGVPVVGIPIGADQMLNMKKTEMEGAGLTLEWSNLSADGIYNAVRRVLDEPSFRENLKRRSAIMKDQPETPLERAVFWTEYVIRHKGAPHLRSAARELTWYQYHLVDVWAFIILVLTLLVVGSLLAVRSCFRLCFGSKSKDGAKSKKGAKRD